MFDNVCVRDWMICPVVSITPDTSLAAARRALKDNVVRRLPVIADGKLVGIITSGDIREASPSDATTLSIWEVNYLWGQLTVQGVMTGHVVTVHPETSILDAAELMLEHKVSGLPVIDGEGYVVGILTESDIFRMLVRSRVRVSAGGL